MATAQTIPLILERAQQLRSIRSACRQFVALAIEASAGGGAIPAELEAQSAANGSSIEADLADPYNFDWSLLYRGSVLDD